MILMSSGDSRRVRQRKEPGPAENKSPFPRRVHWTAAVPCVPATLTLTVGRIG